MPNYGFQVVNTKGAGGARAPALDLLGHSRGYPYQTCSGLGGLFLTAPPADVALRSRHPPYCSPELSQPIGQTVGDPRG